MRYFVICLIFLAIVPLNAQIVGGGGFCHVTGNPNSFATLQVIDSRYNCTNAKDTTTGNIYTYVVTNAVGARWVLVRNDNQNNNWSLIGNSGTVEGTNFLGTTDAHDLTLKANNTELIRLLYGSSSVSFFGGIADGTNSVSMSGGESYGQYSTTMSGGSAAGESATAMSNGYANGDYSTAMSGGSAIGTSSTAMGVGSAIGSSSTAMSGGIAKATNAIAIGYNDITDTPSPTTFAATDRIFQIGNGTSAARSNAFTVIRNGDIGVNILTPQYKLHCIGDISGNRLRYTQNVQYSNPIAASGSVTDQSVLVRNKSDGFIGETNLYNLVAWNGGNAAGSLSIGNRNNTSFSIKTNDLPRLLVSETGILNIVTTPIHHNAAVGDWGFSTMLMRNYATGNVEKTSPYDIAKMTGLVQTDTFTAWPSREITLNGMAHNVYITNRIGSQTNSDSIVINLPYPINGHEINFFVQSNAKLWVMDVILVTSEQEFEDYNALSSNFISPKKRQCIEFGIGSNNPNYDGDFFSTTLGKVWKITANYNELSGKWLVTKLGNN